MTPKEKAIELRNKFIFCLGGDREGNEYFSELWEGKRSALVAVDEILKLELNDGYDHEYWQEVKQEIEKL